MDSGHTKPKTYLNFSFLDSITLHHFRKISFDHTISVDWKSDGGIGIGSGSSPHHESSVIQ